MVDACRVRSVREEAGGAYSLSFTAVVLRRYPLATLDCRDGARRVFMNQADSEGGGGGV